MGDGAMGAMFVASGLGMLALIGWLFIWAVYRIVIKLAQPSLPVGLAITALFLPLYAIPPLVARGWYDDYTKEMIAYEKRKSAEESTVVR